MGTEDKAIQAQIDLARERDEVREVAAKLASALEAYSSGTRDVMPGAPANSPLGMARDALAAYYAMTEEMEVRRG